MINQVVRYEAVLGLIGRSPGRTLVDVGSGAVGLAPLVSPRWTVTAVDNDFTDYGATSTPLESGGVRIVKGDARRLPFADREFDVAVALDLLEHVGPADREAVCGELARVADRRVIVGCPAGPRAEESDARLFAEVTGRGLSAEGWLDEHVRFGFPDERELRAWLAPHGAVRLLGNENVRFHASLMKAELRRPGRRISRGLSQLLLPLIREDATLRIAGTTVVRLLRGGDRRPTYRTIAVVERPAAGRSS